MFKADKELAGKTVTIRQTKNPYTREPQYIAYNKVTLNSEGWLDLQNLGLPGEGRYGVMLRPGQLESLNHGMNGYLRPAQVREALEAVEGDVITVMDPQDLSPAYEWLMFVQKQERKERNREYWASTFGKMWAPVTQWIGVTVPGPASQIHDCEVSEGDNGAKDDELLEVVSERLNVLYGSGLTHRRNTDALVESGRKIDDSNNICNITT